MNGSAKLEAVNKSCGAVNRAKTRAWNNLCALNDNALHKKTEVLLLGMDLDILHEIRNILRVHPDGNEEVAALLECLRETVFGNITNCIHCITKAASESIALDAESRLSIKHKVEGALVQAGGSVRRLLTTFDMHVAAEPRL